MSYRKPKADPMPADIQLVVALESFTWDRPGRAGRGIPLYAGRGQTFAPDDPIVQAHPEAFAPANLPSGQLDALRQAVRERKRQANAARQAAAAERITKAGGRIRNYPSGPSFSVRGGALSGLSVPAGLQARVSSIGVRGRQGR